MCIFWCFRITERGYLHGRFLLWLLGGLNPDDIHEKLHADMDFGTRFFEFLEDIIYHHLPDIEVDVNSTYEPRVERPSMHPVMIHTDSFLFFPHLLHSDSYLSCL